MRISILGTRGIPASYSGFETSVQETSKRFVAAGVETAVYCRSGHYKAKEAHFQGVRLIHLPCIPGKHLETISHTLLSVVHVVLRRCDAVVLYGLGNAIFVPLLRLFGIPVISVVDGADWDRKKWGRFAKMFFRASRHIAVTFSNKYVVDNELLSKEYGEKFRAKPTYIPYGANPISCDNKAVLKKWGLEEKGYLIFVGRFVKEKGVDFLIRNFEQIETPLKLVIVGDNTSDLDYVRSLKDTNDTRIIFTGFLYGPEYESLLHHALFYVSASLLEGTSPSLLAAMAINGFALVSDLAENREVLKGTCATFKVGDSEDFKNKLTFYLKNLSEVERVRETTRRVVSEYYDWDVISARYLELVRQLTA